MCRAVVIIIRRRHMFAHWYDHLDSHNYDMGDHISSESRRLGCNCRLHVFHYSEGHSLMPPANKQTDFVSVIMECTVSSTVLNSCVLEVFLHLVVCEFSDNDCSCIGLSGMIRHCLCTYFFCSDRSCV